MPDRRSFLAALSLGPFMLGGAARAQSSQAYAVVVGDSIAEGEPQRKGRLNVQGRFVPDHVSQPGQLSYELAAASGVFHFNHGIGGQTSTAVRARWRRDVLAEHADPGDGRGPRTLPAGTLPQLAYLHVGINDVATGVPLSALQDNFAYFAQSTSGRMILVVDNIGSWLGMTAPMIEVAGAFNRWLADTLAPRHPHVAVVDYLSWSSNGSGNFRTMAPDRFADGLHPTMAGYADFAQFIRRTLQLPPNSPVRY
ncbi:SGNH/GDSL hydrolase family protein [Bordetella genomosp. 13]|uniref:Capsular biosynthesis protein n=1 Tax=Bordetella genomosp. 13 TaxID=463040 RepID=A0A1W6ZIF8_9BORD|nr:SGNH/GDSL hydrolase family protein [Bordetella genomosp. 13]ARP97156.1 capsular biosynthesis protein [Bordetella genomosp. 13]